MKYVHVRQEAQDPEMEQFEAQNIVRRVTLSGFGPVEGAENRENAGSGGKLAGRPK